MTQSHLSLLLLILTSLLGQCNRKLIQPAAIYRTNVPEPSGLHYDAARDILLTVSDRNGDIYLLDKEGGIIDRLRTAVKDAEGITVVDTAIVLVSESENRLYYYDFKGKRIRKADIDYKNKGNNGLEGLDYDPKNGQFYLVNEKQPCVFIQYDPTSKLLKESPLDLPDASGVCYDSNSEKYLILSDEKQSIILLDLNLKMKREFKLDILKPEGIALDKKTQKLWIISDETGQLFEFDYKPFLVINDK